MLVYAVAVVVCGARSVGALLCAVCRVFCMPLLSWSVAGGVRVIPPPVWVCVACNSRLNLFRRLARF